MGRGRGEEDHNKTDFQDPRRLRYLLNVLKVDLMGTMRNAFYYQKINLTKNRNTLLCQTKVASSVHLADYYNQTRGVFISDLEDNIKTLYMESVHIISYFF